LTLFHVTLTKFYCYISSHAFLQSGFGQLNMHKWKMDYTRSGTS